MTQLLKLLKGSRNYGLATKGSDYDYTVFTVPSFEVLYHQKEIGAAHTSLELDYTEHDIRKLPQLIRKANPAVLELLYSQSLNEESDPCAWEVLKLLQAHRYDLLMHDPARFYKALLGTMNQKLKEMERKSPSRAESIAMHGYDLKSFHHLARLRQVAITCADMYNGKIPQTTNPFFYEEGSLRDELIQYKVAPTAGYHALALKWIGDVESLGPVFLKAKKGENNPLIKLEEVIYDLVRSHIKKEMMRSPFVLYGENQKFARTP